MAKSLRQRQAEFAKRQKDSGLESVSFRFWIEKAKKESFKSLIKSTVDLYLKQLKEKQ